MKIEAGKTYEAEFPFLRVVTRFPKFESVRWKPGYDRIPEPPDGGNSTTVATTMGKVSMDVVKICELPGRYIDRVFFTRRWLLTDSYSIGGKRLEVATISKFKRMTEGVQVEEVDPKYRVYEGEVFND